MAKEIKRKYLDFSVDPVVAGGVSRRLATRMQGLGWDKYPLEADVYAHVQFRNKKKELYYRDGWVKAGTIVFGHQEQVNGVFDGFEMVGGCGNVMMRYR